MMRPEGTCARDFFPGKLTVSNRTVSQFSDALLLRHYVTDANEGAFSELVRRYQHLVLGASYRRSGDLELARDVAQQVFAALARKANLLADRESLAGWLHQATMYETYRTLQSEGRRRTRHELIALDQPEPALNSPAETGAWAALDEAIDRLPSADREALAMHYFQDLSYQEMAVVLGVNEAAVRKRVSRALQRLGGNLRESGLTQTAAALLAGAVAIQNGVAVPANLAQAALALAAAGRGGSAFLTLTAIMSNGLFKTAATIVAAALAWFVWQSSSPEEKPGTVVASSANVAAGDASAPPAPGAGAPGTNRRPAFENQPGERSLGRSQVSGSGPFQSKAVAAKEQKTVAARTAEPATSSPAPAQDVTDRLAPKATPMRESATAGEVVSGVSGVVAPALTLDVGPAMAELRGVISPVGGLLTDLPALPASLRQLELLPVEAAEFYAVLLDRALALTPAEAGRVRGVLEKHFIDRALSGFAGPRPENIAQPIWDESRAALRSDVVEQVTDAVPIAAAVPQIVEDILGLADAPPTDSISLADAQLPAAESATGTLLGSPLGDVRAAVANPPATPPVGNPIPALPDVAGGLLPGGR